MVTGLVIYFRTSKHVLSVVSSWEFRQWLVPARRVRGSEVPSGRVPDRMVLGGDALAELVRLLLPVLASRGLYDRQFGHHHSAFGRLVSFPITVYSHLPYNIAYLIIVDSCDSGPNTINVPAQQSRLPMIR